LTKKVTLTFKGIDCTEALKILSEQSGADMAVAAGVGGTISLFIADVDVATVLDLVTEMTGNAYIVEGDIIRIIPETDYLKQTGNAFRTKHALEVYTLEHVPVKDALVAATQLGLLTGAGKMLPDVEDNGLVIWDVPETHDRIRRLLELIDRQPESETVVLPLQYVGTDSLLGVVAAHLTEGVGGVELLGGRDRIAITDLPSRIPSLKELVSDLDVSPRQVLMEVKILRVSYSDKTSVGINWQVVQEDLNSLDIRSVYPVLPRTTSGEVSSGTVLAVGDLEDDDFNAVVEALSLYGSTEIVSLPRIVGLSGHEASIHVGSTEPYTTMTTRESQGVINYYESVTEVEVGVKLNITPTIHPNDFISMRVRPEVTAVSHFYVSPSGSSIPVVEGSMMETVVRVKDGVYVILGGLMQKEFRKTKTGVPILKDIPLLGYLFGSASTEEVRSELVIMIRPRIVTGDRPIELEESIGGVGQGTGG
jgi:general secretion pathway protein D